MTQELHVLPARGGWLVSGAWFATVGEAEQAARDASAAAGGVRIYLHDLYHRVRAVATG